MTVRRDSQRHHRVRRATQSWHSFSGPTKERASGDSFGALSAFDEYRLAKGANVPRHPRRDAEMLTYVHEGAISYVDSRGGSGVLQAGEFQRLTVNHRDRQTETNASNVDGAHFFQIDLRPSRSTLTPGAEQKRFSVAERSRTRMLCAIASPDGREGSLQLQQDSFLYSVLLSAGQHIVHELLPERSAWLQVVEGQASIGDSVLSAGDGAGLTAERALSITALGDCELLLLDLPRASLKAVIR